MRENTSGEMTLLKRRHSYSFLLFSIKGFSTYIWEGVQSPAQHRKSLQSHSVLASAVGVQNFVLGTNSAWVVYNTKQERTNLLVFAAL